MKAPRLPSMFKLTEHNRYRRFSYNPRVYDPQKERLEERRRQIEAELKSTGNLSDSSRGALRERITESWARKESRRVKRNSGIRLLLILGILVVLLYAIYSKMGFSN